MFPCPLHNKLDSEAQANVIRRSKLAQDQGVEVKWVDHEIHESMIIINPPTEDNPNPDRWHRFDRFVAATFGYAGAGKV